MYCLEFEHVDIHVSLELKRELTVLSGDNGTGKTFLFNVVRDWAFENDRDDIICLSYPIYNTGEVEGVVQKLKDTHGNLVLVDNADDMRQYKDLIDLIESDLNNYYIVMGRSFGEDIRELARVQITKQKNHIDMRVIYLLPY